MAELADIVHERQKDRVRVLDQLLKAAGATRVRIAVRRGAVRAFAKTAGGIRVAAGDSIVAALLALLEDLTTGKANQ